MQTNLGFGISHWLEKKGMTQRDLSKLSGISEGGLTLIIKRNRRPDEDTLKALCNCWGDAQVELTLVCHHLRDEIVRSGKQNRDFTVEINESVASNTLEDDLMLIKSEAQEWDDVRELLHELARMIRRSAGHHVKHLAAEPKATYKTKRGK